MFKSVSLVLELQGNLLLNLICWQDFQLSFLLDLLRLSFPRVLIVSFSESLSLYWNAHSYPVFALWVPSWDLLLIHRSVILTISFSNSPSSILSLQYLWIEWLGGYKLLEMSQGFVSSWFWTFSVLLASVVMFLLLLFRRQLSLYHKLWAEFIS